MDAFHYAKDSGNFSWNSNGKVHFGFHLTGIFRITSGGGPHILIGIFWPKLSVPILTNRFFAPINKFGKRIRNDQSHFYWLAWFHGKMSFHFPQVFPLISDWSVWHNGKHPMCCFRIGTRLGCSRLKEIWLGISSIIPTKTWKHELLIPSTTWECGTEGDGGNPSYVGQITIKVCSNSWD